MYLLYGIRTPKKLEAFRSATSFRAVVRRTHFVSLRMRELKLDQVWISALFIEQRRRGRSEAVAGVLFVAETKPA